MDFLNPLEVDDRDDTYLKVGILGDVHLIGLDRAMQPFIKKKIALFGECLPVGKRSGRPTVVRGLDVIVDIMPRLTGTGFTIAAKHAFEFLEKVGAWAEVA